MNNSSRTSNAVKNIAGGIGGQVITSVFMFVCRMYFIRCLGAEYLGVSGLCANILSLLSLAELGVEQAIIYSMYRPIAERDEQGLARLVNLYRRTYRVIAAVIALVGLALVPFLDAVIKDKDGIENLRLIFILTLMNMLVTFMFSHKTAVLKADQRSYVTVFVKNICTILQKVVQIVLLCVTGSFIVYLAADIASTLVSNVVQSLYVDRKYPFLAKYRNLRVGKEEKDNIVRRVRGMSVHKIGEYIMNGTDNIILSRFVGLAATGIYSNYLSVITIIKMFVKYISDGITAGVGNLIVKESREKSYDTFKALFLVYFWIYAFCFIGMWVVFQPFMKVWIGAEYLLGRYVLCIILLNFLFGGFLDCVKMYINASGYFRETRIAPIIECVIKITASVILAKMFGMAGVFIGTSISFFGSFWINPIVMYRKQFGKNPMWYFARFVLYTAIAVGAALLTDWVCGLVTVYSAYAEIALRAAMCIVLPNVVFLLLFAKTREFRYCVEHSKGIFKRKQK